VTGLGVDDLFGLTGRVALVTGATGRLGSVMVRTLAAAGARTWLVGRDEDRLRRLTDEIRADGLDARWARCDVTVDADVRELGAAVRADGDRLDVLVHNAHVAAGGTLATAGPADFARASDLALSAFQRLLSATRELLAAAAAGGSPSVITVSSMYGMVSPRPGLYASQAAANPPYYGAVKAALIQLSRYAAVELAPLGIRVNALTPGPFPGAADADFVRRLGEQSPLGRVGETTEIATALLFLASPRSSYVTGSNVVVDGGWTAW
jgi:NAD(P)-dependent dehydrogenase (short-subunit alcohol dehydrogenase family)